MQVGTRSRIFQFLFCHFQKETNDGSSVARCHWWWWPVDTKSNEICTINSWFLFLEIIESIISILFQKRQRFSIIFKVNCHAPQNMGLHSFCFLHEGGIPNSLLINHSIVIVSYNIINDSQHFRCLAVRVLVWSRCKFVLFRIAPAQRQQSFLLSFVQVPIGYANGEPVLPHESSIPIVCGKVHITESYKFIINSFVSRRSIWDSVFLDFVRKRSRCTRSLSISLCRSICFVLHV